MNNRQPLSKTNCLLKPILRSQRLLASPFKSIRIVIGAVLLGIMAFGASYSPRPASSFSSSPRVHVKSPVLPFAETIATFAADCTTPKSSFFLGETVCAKTDDVDLMFPGGRWVHWLRSDNSIAFGSSSTTLITQNPQFFAFTPDQIGSWKATIAETGDISQTPAVFTVDLASESVATYDSSCTLAKDHFNTGDTVCAKVDPNFTGSRFVYWVDAQGAAVQTDVVTPTSPSVTRTMNVAGNWWVYFSDSDGSLRSKHGFTVSDPTEPQVDLAVFKSKLPGDLVGGGFVTYSIYVTNRGPDTASTVELSDPLPQNLTLISSTQDSGPAFTQGSPASTWSNASLPAGAVATFTNTYQVANVATGTEIVNDATISSTTQEIHLADNSSSVSALVTSGSPGNDCSLDCPNNIVTTATTHGEGGGATVTFSAAEGVGSCGTITASPASGSFFPIGTTTVVVTSSQGGGGCSFTVTVVDTAGPTIACPANISVTANAGQGQAFVPNPNGASSNVGTPTVTGDQPLEVTGSREDGDALTGTYPLGVTKITWIATDPSGRQATCTQLITVAPNQLLTISCPANVTVASPNGCDPKAGVNVGQATSNSPTATISAERSDGQLLTDPYPVGTTTIVWTAVDTDTQSASCTQTVTVTGTDTTPPILTVPANVSVTTSSCSVLLDDELGVATAEDPDCGAAVSISRTGLPQVACPTPQNPNQTCDSFVFPTGVTIITYTATNSSGLTSTGTQTVTVTEDPAVPPTVTAPADFTLFTGAGATSCGVTVANLDATLGTAIASDNCPGVVVTRIGVPAGNNFPLGTTTVTYRATDKSGNFVEDTQVVTVVDNTPPSISCPANITLDPSCPTGAIATWTAPVGTDNCPGATTTRTAGPAPGSVFPIGATTVTYSVTDANGNGPVSCSFTVSVLTPQAVIQELIAAVNASSLTGTQKNGLLAKLNAALDGINQGKTNVACNKLSDFVNNVGTLVSHGDLTPAVGNGWISRANNVRNTIGCTNLPCS